MKYKRLLRTTHVVRCNVCLSIKMSISTESIRNAVGVFWNKIQFSSGLRYRPYHTHILKYYE